MRSSRRIVALASLIAVFSGSYNGQVRKQVPSHDPFLIANGSTFSASGGSSPRSAAGSAGISAIANSLLEAQQIIAGNHVGGRRLAVKDLISPAMDSMLHSLDPHSNFHNASEWKDLLDEQRSGYTGMGATIASFTIGGSKEAYILATHPGTSADRARLAYGDRIVAIDGRSVGGMDLDNVRDLLRGPSGTTFRLTVERASTNQVETVDMRRGRVPQPSIPDAYLLRPEVGYIELSEGFNYTTSNEFDISLRELKRAGMRSLILDLRGNRGGIVDQAVTIAEKFLPAGTLILTQRGRARIDNRSWRSRNNDPENMPLVVLVDEETASASEIVAGAFQDMDRALIVGERTFGKGLVQSVIDLPGRTGLTLTTGRYLTPSGRSIQRDYSRGDLYDYYQHKAPANAIGKPFFEARTLTDRRVFGGDGILPDELVHSAVISNSELALLDPIFHFTRELINGRVLGENLYRLASYLSDSRAHAREVHLPDSLVRAYRAFAQRLENGAVSSSFLVGEDKFVRGRLRYQIALALSGPTAAARVLIEEDPQVARAIDSLPAAAKLSRSAAMVRTSHK